MPEPLDTIRRVTSDEPMTVAELRRAGAVLDRFTKSGKTDVLQARLRVNSRLEEQGATPGLAKDLPAALGRLRVLNNRMDKGPEPTRDELVEARSDLEPYAQEGRYAIIEHGLARIDARLAAIDTGQPLVEPAKPKADKQSIMGGIAILVVLAAILVSCVAIVSGGDDSSSDGGRDEIGAGVMCEEFIKDQLKSPSSADFQNSSQYVISGTGDTYTVQGYVDAENSFGASLRSNFTCTVRDNGDDSWNLVSLTGLG